MDAVQKPAIRRGYSQLARGFAPVSKSRPFLLRKRCHPECVAHRPLGSRATRELLRKLRLGSLPSRTFLRKLPLGSLPSRASLRKLLLGSAVHRVWFRISRAGSAATREPPHSSPKGQGPWMVPFRFVADGLGVLGLSLPHALFVSVASDFLDIDRTAAKRDPRALIASPHEQARSSLLDGEIQYRVH